MLSLALLLLVTNALWFVRARDLRESVELWRSSYFMACQRHGQESQAALNEVNALRAQLARVTPPSGKLRSEV